MRIRFAACLLLALAGCTSGGTTTTPTTTPRGSGPAEDVWSIRCVTLQGPDRFAQAENCAEQLRHVKGLKADLVQVLHSEDDTAVYYGRYQRLYNERTNDEGFRPNPQKDLDMIRELSLMVDDAQAGRRPVWPFRLATLDTLPTARPSHPEWELANAKGFYSLQIAVFYDTEGMRQRKTAAEEYCRILREQGEEAYFDHGPVHSCVFIGTFPEGALQVFEEPDPMTGGIHVRQKIVDKRMLDLQRKYPHNLHNGHTFYDISRDPTTGKKIRDPHLSFPVRIPQHDAGAVIQP